MRAPETHVSINFNQQRKLEGLTLWRLDADPLEPLRLLHGPYDGLDELVDLLIKTTHVAVLLGGLFVHLHCLDSAIILGRQGVQNKI
jgi:hypothetical protein